MIDHSLVIARLAATGLFKQLGGAAEATAAMAGTVPIGDGPAAFVVPIADHPDRPLTDSGIQAAVVTFGVLVMIRKASDPLGATALDPLKQLQNGLHASLLGWDGLDGFSALWWSGGRILELQPGALWWLEEYSASTGIAPD